MFGVPKGGKYPVGFWLTVIPGLVGIFGLGHLYVGEKRRAYAFNAVTLVLLALVLVAFLAPAYLPPLLAAPGMPAIWFLGWISAIFDIRNLATRQSATTTTPTAQIGVPQRN